MTKILISLNIASTCERDTGQREAAIELFSWAEAAYAVHVACRSHLGTCMSIGRHNTAKVQQTSAKAKRNHLWSIEAEVEAGVKAAFNIVCAKAFLAELGFSQYGPTALCAECQRSHSASSSVATTSKTNTFCDRLILC